MKKDACSVFVLILRYTPLAKNWQQDSAWPAVTDAQTAHTAMRQPAFSDEATSLMLCRAQGPLFSEGARLGTKCIVPARKCA
ncbi:hypothetical protein HK16_10460 [Acetobacter senegalensis]|uniref:Uncharacterized protein n=2 Tax=Acetobacter TaxID=434 RepID=A0A252EJI0_9PROT|nr:hypothetical protein CIW82_07245 [Acetobacter tropicalis]OUL66364.1 hypothetical protein HK16_10460 [Acetobacter senegalensis]